MKTTHHTQQMQSRLNQAEHILKGLENQIEDIRSIKKPLEQEYHPDAYKSPTLGERISSFFNGKSELDYQRQALRALNEYDQLLGDLKEYKKEVRVEIAILKGLIDGTGSWGPEEGLDYVM